MRLLQRAGTRRSQRNIIMALSVALSVALALVFGCSSRIDEPAYDNPLDPNGPTGGDPFGVEATASGNNVLIAWFQVEHPDVVSYIVLHSLDEQSFSVAGQVDHLQGADKNNFLHGEAAPNAINWYKVQALSSDGFASSSTTVMADTTWTQPFFEIAGGASSTPTRFVSLRISTTAGDFLEIADNDTFAGSTIMAAEPGDTTEVAWDLGSAGDNGDEMNLYLRVQTGPLFSQVAARSIQTSFNPSFNIVGDENGVATQVVDLQITDDVAGIDSMRFARSPEMLPFVPWVAGDTLYSGYTLMDSPLPQTIWGEFKSDFGYNTTSSYEALPDDLSDVSFIIKSLDSNEDITDSIAVLLLSSFAALEMRFSESPTFVGVPWVAYDDTTLFPLSEEPGLKVVYGQFRNFWAQSPTVSDAISLVTQEIQVEFLHPLNGMVVLGGSQLTAMGFAVPAAGFNAVDMVEVDLGDGLGFNPATGTESWSIDWEVPLFREDRDLILRARAIIVDTDTATTAITVTVTQLAVSINQPADGDTLTVGTDVTVAGTAAPVLGGAALDSVVVGLAGTDTTLTENLAGWSVTLSVPDETGAPQDVIATSWAGGEFSLPHTISVTIITEQP